MVETLRKNQIRIVVIAILLLLFLSASLSMDVKDWVITVLRGLSVGAIVFLVAAGFSLIFGLMDVLNLAHGELFMVGAYVGWTIYVRPGYVCRWHYAAGVIGSGVGAVTDLLCAGWQMAWWGNGRFHYPLDSAHPCPSHSLFFFHTMAAGHVGS